MGRGKEGMRQKRRVEKEMESGRVRRMGREEEPCIG